MGTHLSISLHVVEMN
ncbi:unnamed protein product [Victoria cruziana]